MVDLEIVTDLGGCSEHDRGGAILLGAQVYGPLYLLFLEIASTDDEVGVDVGEYLGILCRTLGFELDHTIGHLLARLAQDQQDIELGAAAHSEEKQLHWPCPEIASTEVWGAVHDEGMSAAGFPQHGYTFDPFDTCFHRICPLASCAFPQRGEEPNIVRRNWAAGLESTAEGDPRNVENRIDDNFEDE
jgi:hypothetical protein